MKRTTIAAVAHNCSTGDSDKNLALMEEVLAGGEISETDIYVFPELNISGGVIKTDLVDLGETVPDGSHVGEVCALSKRYQTAICRACEAGKGSLGRFSTPMAVSRFKGSFAGPSMDLSTSVIKENENRMMRLNEYFGNN